MAQALTNPRICVVPHLSGVGGMVSFQKRLTRGLARLGVEVGHDLRAGPYAAVLVIGGTRDLAGLWRARQRGTPIVQRLDGMNWMHRVRRTGLRHYLRAEYGNLLLRIIRARLADRIVYQSRFAQSWWERSHGPTGAPTAVIHNGVDLHIFTPEGPHQRPTEATRLLLVEGSLLGGYEVGLEHAVALAEGLNRRGAAAVELMVVGRVNPDQRARWERRAGVPMRWAGLAPPERIPEIDRSAHLLFSGDLNPACPNAVIEALACGLPVAAFATGALPELVSEGAGFLAPYGGDPWRLDPPDMPTLAEGALAILEDQARYRAAARARAETAFGLEAMAARYLSFLRGDSVVNSK